MLDTEFLAGPQMFGSLLIYRFRSGILRSRMKAAVESFAARRRAYVLHVDVSEIAFVWAGGLLGDGVMFCDVPADKRSKLALESVLHLFEVPPAAPTIVFVDAEVAQAIPETVSGIVIEEAIVGPANLLSVL